MKYIKYIYILTFVFIISCDTESYISDSIKDAFPVDYYKQNDTLNLFFYVNDKLQDTVSLVINENYIDTVIDYDILGTTHVVEEYVFNASNANYTQQIILTYSSDNKSFEGYVDFGEIYISFDGIEEEIDSIEINNKQYTNIYLLNSMNYDNSYAYMSNNYGIVEIVNDSIKFVANND
ncbi:MAG: hypothetical protein PF436_08350 [Prolixibacteraceae bacterium]|jgi:hypothetical protein|nr:hypothetical protein [Prolixibacteraceae bacterium]